ncbi:type II secretion system F family protein [Sinomonas sp.]|uniref:type II secretion system F family protein n=1 Tax=Sinomonas sp. TaxID=1914986 RepID=UPI002FE05486
MSVGGGIAWPGLLAVAVGLQLFAACCVLLRGRGAGRSLGLVHALPDRGWRNPLHPASSGLRPTAAGDEFSKAALVLELIAAMLESGSSLHRALRIVAQAVGQETGSVARAATALELGVPWGHAWTDSPEDRLGRALREALDFAAETGAPSAGLISARARMLRRERHRELERRAAALGVKLVVPLGICSLPAFLCLGVVPLLLSMAP